MVTIPKALGLLDPCTQAVLCVHLPGTWCTQAVYICLARGALRLRNENELAYISGGWVRDALLGRPSADIDIATSASVQTQVRV